MEPLTISSTPAASSVTKNDRMITIVPIRLKRACASAARRALAFVPIEAKIAVTVVPMLSPKTIGTAVQTDITPLSARAMVMPIVAALTGADLQLIGIGYVFGMAGEMITPAHLCMVISVDYFKSDFVRFWWQIFAIQMMVLSIFAVWTYLVWI